MKIKKYIVALSFVLLFSTSADAQLFNRAKRIELQDSIVRLNAIIDSLQFVFDDLLDRSYEMLENETSKESLYDPFSDEDFPDTADSLLSVYYLQQDLSSIYETGIVNLEDTLLPSDIPDSVYIDRLNKMNSYIKIPYNNTVRNYIVNYTQKNQELTRRILGLAKYYMPIFEEIFIEYNLPQELKAMAVIESALNQRAVSRAKAKGMWQFMYQTALKYNLQIDSYIDERLDPVASCRAAARYLRDSYDIFGDWSLAIASYNCGAGNVNKAIRRAGGGNDFWDIYRFLPRETRGYVPAFVGALYTLNYYKEHNLTPIPAAIPPHVDTFHVNKNLHFGQVSEVIGISMEEIRDLNPQYLHDVIPGASKEYLLKLPYNYTIAFVDHENEIYGYKDSVYFSPIRVKEIQSGAVPGSGDYIVYKVKSGDTLGAIASRNKTTVANLKSWNGLRSNTIRVGQSLKIYGKSSSSSSSNSSSKSSSSSKVVTQTSNDGYLVYTVEKGDTLWEISNKFSDVSLHDILTLNGFTRNTKIYPGMKIKIKKQ